MEMNMETYDIWSERGGVRTYEGKITGEAKAKEWIGWYLKENPGAHAWKFQWQPPNPV
jgi:hypothetical protein